MATAATMDAADRELARALFQSYYAISSSDGPTGRVTPGTVMASTFALTCNLMQQLVPEALPSNLPPTLFDDLATDKEFLEVCELAMKDAMVIAKTAEFGKERASGPSTDVDGQRYSGGTSERSTPYLEEVTKALAGYSVADVTKIVEIGMEINKNNPLFIFILAAFVFVWLVAQYAQEVARDGVSASGAARFAKKRPKALLTFATGCCYGMTMQKQVFAPPNFPELQTTAWNHAYNTTVLPDPYWEFAQPQSFKIIEMIRLAESQQYPTQWVPWMAMWNWYDANGVWFSKDSFFQSRTTKPAWNLRKLAVDYGPEQVIKVMLKDSMLDFYEREEMRRNIVILYDFFEHVHRNRPEYDRYQNASFLLAIIFSAGTFGFAKEAAVLLMEDYEDLDGFRASVSELVRKISEAGKSKWPIMAPVALPGGGQRRPRNPWPNANQVTIKRLTWRLEKRANQSSPDQKAILTWLKKLHGLRKETWTMSRRGVLDGEQANRLNRYVHEIDADINRWNTRNPNDVIPFNIQAVYGDCDATSVVDALFARMGK